jgi:DivIVA domain-containing protein
MPDVRLDDPESLRRAYVDEGLSLSTIAEEAGCSDATVRRVLLRLGIEIRRSGPVPIKELRDVGWLRARVEEGSTVKELADFLGCAESSVRSSLHWAGIDLATARQRPAALRDPEFLARAYVTERRSVRSIAEELGCNKDAVLLALRTHGLPIRARGRAGKHPAASDDGQALASLEAPPAQGRDGPQLPVRNEAPLDQNNEFDGGTAEVPSPDEYTALSEDVDVKGEPDTSPPDERKTAPSNEMDPPTEDDAQESDLDEPEAPAMPASASRLADDDSLRLGDPEELPASVAASYSADDADGPSPAQADAALHEDSDAGAPLAAATPSGAASPRRTDHPGLERTQGAFATRGASEARMGAAERSEPRAVHRPSQADDAAPAPVTAPRATGTPEPSPRAASRGATGPSAGGPRRGRVILEIQDIASKTFPISRRGYDRDEVDKFLHVIAEEYRQVLQSARRAVDAAQQAAARQPSPPHSQSFAEIGGSVAAVLASAAEAAEEIKALAEEQAEAIRHKAYEDTVTLRQSAEDQLAEAEHVRAITEHDAAEALERARVEAADLLERARRNAAEIEEAAVNSADTLERTARANTEALLAVARRDYEHLRSVQQQCVDRLATVEFLAKHAREGLSDGGLSDGGGEPLVDD